MNSYTAIYRMIPDSTSELLRFAILDRIVGEPNAGRAIVLKNNRNKKNGIEIWCGIYYYGFLLSILMHMQLARCRISQRIKPFLFLFLFDVDAVAVCCCCAKWQWNQRASQE